MFDDFELNFDLDGDGILDSRLDQIDLNGDGIADGESLLTDTNNDGILDRNVLVCDSDNNGIFDTMEIHDDYDQDGMVDSSTTFVDIDEDGDYEAKIVSSDTDGDTIVDSSRIYIDTDSDGEPDQIIEEELLDDGRVVVRQDFDGDGVFDSEEVMDYGDYDPFGGASVNATMADELDNFNPDESNPDDVIGDPEEAMEHWEYQEDTNRCALYSQKFIIEELRGEEIDMEEFANLAEENGWFTEEEGTPLLNMNKLLDYYGISNDMSWHNGIEDIENCLNSDGKVIVSVDADEIWYGESNEVFSPADGANHAVEVIGVDYSDSDNPMVILNDSGNPNGCGEMVPLDTFMDAWEDGNYQMIVCM